MEFAGSAPGTGSHGRDDVAAIAAVKLLVAGGVGVGKTTMVASVGEVASLRENSTTVATDFGRIAISPELILYLFGIPAEKRFWFMWDELAEGALGAVLLVDTRSLESSASAIKFFEHRQIPFVVGVNCFDEAPARTIREVRAALGIDPRTPVMRCDVRRRESSRELLIAVTERALAVNSR